MQGAKPMQRGRRGTKTRARGGGGISEHGRVRSRCSGGGAAALRVRVVSQRVQAAASALMAAAQVQDCGGSGICEHGRLRYNCKERARPLRARAGAGKECGGSSQETILLDVTVAEAGEDAEPDEWIPQFNHTLSWLPGREAVSHAVA